jgi:hypothetical protein
VTRSALALVLVAAVAGLAGPVRPTPAAPVPKHLMKDVPICYPLRAGTRTVATDLSGKTVRVVTKVEHTETGKMVWTDTENATGQRRHAETVIVSEKGVEVVEFAGQKLNPTFWWFKLPHSDDNTWEDRFGLQVWTGKTLDWEEIEVTAGKFRALHVQHVEKKHREQTTDYWFAPGAGCVKWTLGNSTYEVVSFVPGR